MPAELTIAVASLVTYAWRAAGVLCAEKMRAESATLRFVTCVTYSLLAALVARLVLFPQGGLEESPIAARIVGMGVALAIFFILKRNVAAGAWLGALAFLAAARILN